MESDQGEGVASDNGSALRREIIEVDPSLDYPSLVRRLREASRNLDLSHYTLAFYLNNLSLRRLQKLSGYSSVVQFAVCLLGMSRRDARDHLKVGRALTRLPKIDGALREGRLSWTKARLLVRIVVPATEEAWLEKALSVTCSALEVEVSTSQRGRLPRKDRKGLPTTKVCITASVDPETYETWEMARKKLVAETGESLSYAQMMRHLAEQVLLSEMAHQIGRAHV